MTSRAARSSRARAPRSTVPQPLAGAGNPPHAVWRFRDRPGLLGSGDVAASYGNDEWGGRFSVGDRHSDGYRQQDQDDHLHFAGKARWQGSIKTRVDVSGAWAVDRYD